MGGWRVKVTKVTKKVKVASILIQNILCLNEHIGAKLRPVIRASIFKEGDLGHFFS